MGRECTIDGCGKKHAARGWCYAHYIRWKVHGSPHCVNPPGPKADLSRWVADPNSGCWIWIGSVAGDGYATSTANGKKVYLHRVFYERKFGPIPPGMYIDHKCKVKCCINPDHLRVVTPRQNVVENSTSWAALHSAQTHCVNGHEFNNNTWMNKGHRYCRECRRMNCRKSWKIHGKKYYIRAKERKIERKKI